MKKKISKKISLMVSFSLLGLGITSTTIYLSSCSSNSNKSNTNDSSSANKPSDTNNDSNVRPEINSNALDATGGNYNNLHTSSYLQVVKTLDLAQNTELNTLTSITLNNQLHKNDSYKNLSLTIEQGSNTKIGQLVLSLNGEYNNQIINNQKITISNFNHLDDNFTISDIKLNLVNWFDNFQAVLECQSHTKITNDPMIAKTLISNLNVNCGKNTISYQELQTNNMLNNISLKRSYNDVSVDLNITIPYYEFQNGSWKQLSYNPQLRTNSSHSVLLPTIDDLMKTILNQLEPDQEKLNQVYPSIFLGNLVYEFSFPPYPTGSTQANPIKSYFKNDEALIKKYKSYWDYNPEYEVFPYLIANSPSDMVANDKTGDLSFLLSMEFTQNVPHKKNIKHFNFKCKSLNSFIEQNHSKQNEITIINNIKNSNIKKNSDLSKIIYRQVESQVANVTEANSVHVSLDTTNINKTFFECTGIDENHNNNFSYNSYIPSLFGFKIPADNFGGGFVQSRNPFFDTEKGLFCFDGKIESGFYISNIKLDVGSNIDAIMSVNKTIPTKVDLSYQAKLLLTLQGYDAPYEMLSTFTLTLDK